MEPGSAEVMIRPFANATGRLPHYCYENSSARQEFTRPRMIMQMPLIRAESRRWRDGVCAYSRPSASALPSRDFTS